MDNLTLSQRKKCMSHIKRRDTVTEIMFRKAIWAIGIKGYRIDIKLPGRPDIYFPKYKMAVFIDGCFWHKCPKCFIEPKSNKEYWLPKIERNVERDKQNEIKLKKLGVSVVRYWEHDVRKDLDKIIGDFRKKYEEARRKSL